MNPEKRKMLKVDLNEDNAVEADRMFTILMGDVVEPRRIHRRQCAQRAAGCLSDEVETARKSDEKNFQRNACDVTMRDYIASMKPQNPESLRDGDDEAPSSVVQEIAALPGLGQAISVRAAKAHLSGLAR